MANLPYKLPLEEAQLSNFVSDARDWIWSHGRYFIPTRITLNFFLSKIHTSEIVFDITVTV